MADFWMNQFFHWMDSQLSLDCLQLTHWILKGFLRSQTVMGYFKTQKTTGVLDTKLESESVKTILKPTPVPHDKIEQNYMLPEWRKKKKYRTEIIY